MNSVREFGYVGNRDVLYLAGGIRHVSSLSRISLIPRATRRLPQMVLRSLKTVLNEYVGTWSEILG